MTEPMEYIGLSILGLLLIPGTLLVAWFLVSVFMSRWPEFVHQRGARLGTHAEAARRLRRKAANGRAAVPPGFDGIAFGGLRLPLDAAWTHFLLQGQTGSGKTVLLTLFIRSVLALLGHGLGYRAVLFDPKREWPRLAHGSLPPHVPLWLFNPFDRRGLAWDLAADFRTAAEADQLARALIPHEKADTNPYFRDAARVVLMSLVLVLQLLAPGRWTLRDLIVLSQTRKRLASVLRCRRETRHVVAQHLSTPKTAKEIVSTIGSLLGRYATVAACWCRADGTVSLRAFLDQEAVLVLGYEDSVSAALEPINKLILARLSDLILARNDLSRPTFFILDEFRLLGKGELLPLALKGRSAGASLAIAIQDINGLDAVHGEKEARELCGNLLTKGFLRVDSEAAARFASGAIGEEEGKQYTFGETTSRQGVSRSIHEQVVRRPLVLPDEVKGLPLPTWAEGAVEGFFKSPEAGSYRGRVGFRAEIERLRLDPAFPNHVPRPAAEQRLRPFSADDIKRLGLPCTQELLATL